jgi:hypothetical protein
LDLAAVTTALGLQPDVTGRIGEHIAGSPRYAIYQSNVWVYRYTEMDDLTFSQQLLEFITRLEDRADAVRHLVARPGVTAELFLGFSSGNGQGGFTLPASLLTRVVALGLDLTLDLYPPTADKA